MLRGLLRRRSRGPCTGRAPVPARSVLMTNPPPGWVGMMSPTSGVAISGRDHARARLVHVDGVVAVPTRPGHSPSGPTTARPPRVGRRGRCRGSRPRSRRPRGRRRAARGPPPRGRCPRCAIRVWRRRSRRRRIALIAVPTRAIRPNMSGPPSGATSRRRPCAGLVLGCADDHAQPRAASRQGPLRPTRGGHGSGPVDASAASDGPVGSPVEGGWPFPLRRVPMSWVPTRTATGRRWSLHTEVPPWHAPLRSSSPRSPSASRCHLLQRSSSGWSLGRMGRSEGPTAPEPGRPQGSRRKGQVHARKSAGRLLTAPT